MPIPTAYFREAGAADAGRAAVVCLHSNASSSSQWRGLLDLLAPSRHALAADAYGAGKSPEWPSDRTISLADEAALVEPVLACAGAPFILVGHSYGAALALVAALARPERVAALVLYEPTLFGLIDEAAPPPNEADGIRAAVAASAAALDAGDRDAAAGHFIDYWMGPGSWAATPAARRPAIAASVINVRRWAHALLHEPTRLADVARLRMPVLLMSGAHTTASARGVLRLLAPALPRVETRVFDGLGHMGPVTHPEPVNAAIRDFIDRL